MDSVEARIAANLKRRREELGLSLAQLAAQSGVSKAMIAKVESGQSSPTAGLLGRLCAGLGVTLSTLMIEAEAGDMSHYPADKQAVWRDPETGLTRTLVAGASRQSPLEIARLVVPAGTRISYDLPPTRPPRQHIVMLAGELEFTFGEQTTHLRAGDALFAVIDRPTRFFVPGDRPAEYLVIQEPA